MIPDLNSIKAAWAALAAERSLARWRAERADPDAGPLTVCDPPPPRKVKRGKTRTATGRVGAVPKAPVLRRFDDEAKAPEGELPPIPEKPAAPRIVVPRLIPGTSTPGLASVLDGTLSAVLLESKPPWQVGEVVPLVRYSRSGERDEPIMVEVLSLGEVRACDLDVNRVRQMGYQRIGEFAALRYPKVPGNSQMKVRHMALDETSAGYFATFTPSTLIGGPPVALDDERGRANVGVVAPRWLAPAGGAGDGGGGYVESEDRARKGHTLDAGVCVEPEYQAKFSTNAEDSIEEGAKLGLQESETARVVGNKVHRALDSARGDVHARRPKRRATLDRRREEASAEEIEALTLVDGTYSFEPDGHERPTLALTRTSRWSRGTQDAEGNWVPRPDLAVALDATQRPHFNEGGHASPEAA